MTAPAAAPPRAVDPSPVAADPAFALALDRLARGRRVEAGGLWGSSQAMALAEVLARRDGAACAVASTEAEADLLALDLATFGVEAAVLAAREGRGGSSDPDAVRQRLQVAQRLVGPPEGRPRLVVASLRSMLQPVPSAADLERDFLHLERGGRLDPEHLLARLARSGYARQPLAERPGEVSVRGDVVDLFPFAADLPLRIELFDDEVESIRAFDPETQRSVEELARTSVCLASDVGGVEDGRGTPPLELLPPDALVVEVEPLRIADQAEGLRIRSSAHARALQRLRDGYRLHPLLALQSLPGEAATFQVRSVQALAVGVKQAPGALRALAAEGTRALVLCRSEPEERRLREHLDEEGVTDGVELARGDVARGFRLDAAGLVVVAHRELLGVEGAASRAKRRATHHVRALQSFFELKVGDLVVHAVHGVAQYAGLVRMKRAGGEEEHLHLLFADDVSLYVPASRIDLVQRYVGTGATAPQPDKIGGQAFRRRKEKVERALVDLAADLLEVQAKRETQRRDPWDADPQLVRDLLESFPWTDTHDQERADAEVAADLASKRPMDRLLCGDVGFGKTEIAVRAAARVVSGGGQVAVLVPTTVLADQHLETFRSRLAPLGIEVEALSRTVGADRAKDVRERVAAGKVDVLVGTHRILSKDVQFASLGLAIVDEEQRFGVKHKEHYKRLRAEVDLLTLTATPIPRTLHMSLAGIRDISALSDPPEGRQEIETAIAYMDDVGLLREVLRREKARGGQVFFLHNRVGTIGERARELAQLAPECRFAVGHGQMGGRELGRIMRQFVRGEVDVLVATTIVENGIDIPAAGTIVIDRADRHGLAELHQLRGRVGRGAQKAWCYLLLDRTQPVRHAARERLKALEELTSLGAGFQISMKDLELRGAGNILGPEQSGHIAAVGYDMYCRLLKQTVERMSAGGGREEVLALVSSEVEAELQAEAVEMELGIDALLPKRWIPSSDERVEVLRRLSTIEDDAQADDALATLRDRYGRVPPQAAALVRQFRLRPRLARLGIRRLLWRGDAYLLEYADRVALETLLAGRRDVELRPIEAGRASLVLPPGSREPADALAWLEALLSGVAGAPKMAAAAPRSSS